MNTIICAIGGFIVGVLFGFVLAAIMTVSSRSSDCADCIATRMEREES